MGGRDKRHRMMAGRPKTAGEHPTATAKGANRERTKKEKKKRKNRK